MAWSCLPAAKTLHCGAWSCWYAEKLSVPWVVPSRVRAPFDWCMLIGGGSLDFTGLSPRSSGKYSSLCHGMRESSPITAVGAQPSLSFTKHDTAHQPELHPAE